MSGRIDDGSVLRDISAQECGDPGWTMLDEAAQHGLDAAELLFAVDGAALVLHPENENVSWRTGSSRIAAALKDAAALLCDERYDQALRTGFIHQVAGCTAQGRWPDLDSALQDAEVATMLGVPVCVAGNAVGALLLASRTPLDWAQPELRRVEAYAGVVGAMLGAHAEARRQERLTGQLQWALEHRVMIEQAKGVVMAQERVDAATAYQHIRGQARERRVKSVVVADELLSQVDAEREAGPAPGYEANSA